MFVYVPGAPALDLSKGMPNASYWNGKESKPQIWCPKVAHSALINVLFTSILVQVFSMESAVVHLEQKNLPTLQE